MGTSGSSRRLNHFIALLSIVIISLLIFSEIVIERTFSVYFIVGTEYNTLSHEIEEQTISPLRNTAPATLLSGVKILSTGNATISDLQPLRPSNDYIPASFIDEDHGTLLLSGNDSPTSLTTKESSSNDIRNTTTRELPYMFIHIGPHEAGTTSIQNFLKKNRPLLLEKDHTEYMNFGARQMDDSITFFKCIVVSPEVQCSKKFPAMWSDMLRLYSTPATNGNNIIISGEDMAYSDFGSINWREFLDYNRVRYRIEFVMVYRRYFDWLPSDYNQHFKMRGQYNRKLSEPWPSDIHGLEPKTFPNYYINRRPDPWDQSKRNVENEKTGEYTNVALVLSNAIAKLGIPVHICNFHDSDVVKDVVCNSLPFTKHLCEELKNSVKLEPSNSLNNDGYTDRDLLAVAVKESGLLPVNITITRKHMQGQVRNQLRRTRSAFNNLPLTCLEGEQLEEFRRISYESEEVLMPSMLQTHDEAFWVAVKKKKFCSVNATKIILENEEWRSWIQKHFNSR